MPSIDTCLIHIIHMQCVYRALQSPRNQQTQSFCSMAKNFMRYVSLNSTTICHLVVEIWDNFFCSVHFKSRSLKLNSGCWMRHNKNIHTINSPIQVKLHSFQLLIFLFRAMIKSNYTTLALSPPFTVRACVCVCVNWCECVNFTIFYEQHSKHHLPEPKRMQLIWIIWIQ